MSNFLNADKNIKGYFSLNKWQPTTKACAFVQASLDDTLRSLVDWTTPNAARYDATLQRHEVKGTVDDAFSALLPLQPRWYSKHLLLPTTDDKWTAIFDNHNQGTEPHSLATCMNRLYGHNVVYAVDIPHTLSKDKMHGQYGCVEFLYFYGKEQQRGIRLVHGHRGWELGTYGDPLPFEDQTIFDRPRKTDRFNHDELLKYLRGMGIDAANEAFYMPDGRAIIVEEIGQNFR
jgi:hypothetical protein